MYINQIKYMSSISDQSISTSQQPVAASSLTWQQHSGMELGAPSSLSAGQTHPGMDTKSHKENEDVEIMSSDSSSSSSSDD